MMKNIAIVEIDKRILDFVFNDYLNNIEIYSNYYNFDNNGNLYIIMTIENAFELYQNYFKNYGVKIKEKKIESIAKNRILKNVLEDYPELYIQLVDKEFVYIKMIKTEF
jgi:hypothetical protein